MSLPHTHAPVPVPVPVPCPCPRGCGCGCGCMVLYGADPFHGVCLCQNAVGAFIMFDLTADTPLVNVAAWKVRTIVAHRRLRRVSTDAIFPYALCTRVHALLCQHQLKKRAPSPCADSGVRRAFLCVGWVKNIDRVSFPLFEATVPALGPCNRGVASTGALRLTSVRGLFYRAVQVVCC